MNDDDVKNCLVDLLTDMMGRGPLRAAWLAMTPDERRATEGAWADVIARHGAPEPPQYGLTAQADETQVLGALRSHFNAAWRKLFPLPSPIHEPRPMSPEEGHARVVARYLLRSTGHDVTAARARARVFVDGMFRPDLMTTKGRPWSWRAAAGKPDHFFSAPGNPTRVSRDRSEADAFDRRMAEAEEVSDPAAGRAALEALRAKCGTPA